MQISAWQTNRFRRDGKSSFPDNDCWTLFVLHSKIYHCYFLQPIRLPTKLRAFTPVRLKYDRTRYNYGSLDIYIYGAVNEYEDHNNERIGTDQWRLPDPVWIGLSISRSVRHIKKSLLVGGCQRCVGTVGRVEQDGIWNEMNGQNYPIDIPELKKTIE